jgi:hypothetical protein
MHKILVIPQDDQGKKPYTLGITSSDTWAWTLALEQNPDNNSWRGDRYSLRNHGREIARLFWMQDQLAIEYGKHGAPHAIVKDYTLLYSHPGLATHVPSGSLIDLGEVANISLHTEGPLAAWLGSNTNDMARLARSARDFQTIADALAIWHRQSLLIPGEVNHLTAAVYSKVVRVSGKTHADDSKKTAPNSQPDVQLGQIWRLASQPSQDVKVLEYGLFPDLTEPTGYGLGARVVRGDGKKESCFPLVTFALNATLKT